MRKELKKALSFILALCMLVSVPTVDLNASAETTVASVSEAQTPASYYIVLPDEGSDKGFTVTPTVETTGTVVNVNAGESYSFSVDTKAGYTKTSQFAVMANGDVLTADEAGVYTISNIRANEVIEVAGVEYVQKPEEIEGIEFSGYHGVFDGEEHGITVTAAGCEVMYQDEKGDYSLNASPLYTEAGVYPVYFQITSGEAVYTYSAEVNISKRKLPTPVLVNDTLEYTGEDQSITCVNDSYFRNCCTTRGKSSGIEVGDYSFKLHVDSNGVWVNSDGTTSTADVTLGFKIVYHEVPEGAGVSQYDNVWYKEKPLTVTPSSGYKIAFKNEADEWKDSFEVTQEGVSTFDYRLRYTGKQTTDWKNMKVKIDTTSPTIDAITISGASVKREEAATQADIFLHGNQEVTIKATDNTSGIAKIEYYIPTGDLQVGETPKWEKAYELSGEAVTAGSIDASFTIKPRTTEKEKVQYIRLRVYDAAGNITQAYTDGLAVYTEPVVTDVSYTKLTSSPAVEINYKGNTFKNLEIITPAGAEAEETTAVALEKGTQYSVDKNGAITLNSTFLNELVMGTDDSKSYKLLLSYDPLGLDYDTVSQRDKPEKVPFNLTVEKAEPTVVIETTTEEFSKTYNGEPVSSGALAFTTTNDKADLSKDVVIKYKKKDAADVTYDNKAPTNAGEYTVRVTVKANNYYKECSATLDFAINKVIVNKPDVGTPLLYYTGKEQNYTPIDNDATNAALYTVTENTGVAVAATYQAVITLEDEVNYKWDDVDDVDEESKPLIYPFSIEYYDMPDCVVSGTEGTNGWYTSDVTVKAPNATADVVSGFLISTSGAVDGNWVTGFAVTAEGEYSSNYWLKTNDEHEYISKVKNVSFKKDATSPEVKEVKIKGNNIVKQIISKFTFGYFFKDKQTVTITSDDNVI